MKALNTVVGLLVLFVVTPIWYYLVYHILKRVNASELMWFLYWIYVPVGIFAHLLGKVTEGADD